MHPTFRPCISCTTSTRSSYDKTNIEIGFLATYRWISSVYVWHSCRIHFHVLLKNVDVSFKLMQFLLQVFLCAYAPHSLSRTTHVYIKLGSSNPILQPSFIFNARIYDIFYILVDFLFMHLLNLSIFMIWLPFLAHFHLPPFFLLVEPYVTQINRVNINKNVTLLCITNRCSLLKLNNPKIFWVLCL